MIFLTGPDEKWNAELKKLSKNGLLYLAEEYLHFFFTNNETRLSKVSRAKGVGRYLDAVCRNNRMDADPRKYFDQKRRKSEAAIKTARRIKREAKKKGTA